MKINKIFCLLIIVLCLSSTFTQAESRVYIEFSGRFLIASPDDFNLLYSTEKSHLRFHFQNACETRLETGGLHKIKNLQGLCFRIKLSLSSTFQISLGVNTDFTGWGNNYQVLFAKDEGWIRTLDHMYYSSFETGILAICPDLGIHWTKRLSEKSSLEFSLAAGPVFADIEFKKSLHENTYRVFTENNGGMPVYDIARTYNIKGSGTGYSLWASVKFRRDISSKTSLFAEAGYQYSKVKDFSGKGMESAGDYFKFWEGEWGIKHENIITAHGSTEWDFPSNLWEGGQSPIRDFELDLSGFFISFGITFGL